MKKGVANLAKNFFKGRFKSIRQLIKDENGGPGLEETVLLVFVGLVVANAAENLGDIIDDAFSSATTNISDALGL